MKIGFIGCGNMGSAMVGGMIKSKVVNKEEVTVSSKTEGTLNKLRDKFGVNVTLDNKEVVLKSDIIILAVKPYMYEEVIKEIRDVVTESQIIVTIAAGVTIEKVTNWFDKKIKLIKTMPNTPALVGEAMTAMCANEKITDEELQQVVNIFESFGRVELLEEKNFHAFTALCGSSPAYVFMFIEAMADAAVKQGIQRKKAYNLAAQAVLGSAKMVLEKSDRSHVVL